MGTLRNARQQIADRLVGLRGGAASRARVLSQRLQTIEDSLYQGRNQDVEDDLVYPPRVTERISSLLGMVESADGRPPQQAYNVFSMYAPRLQQQLEAAEAALEDARRQLSVAPQPVELRPPAPVGN